MDLRTQLLPSRTAEVILQASILQKRCGGFDVGVIQANQPIHRKLQLLDQHVLVRTMVRGRSLFLREILRLLYRIGEKQCDS